MNELCQRFQESFGDPNMPEELARHVRSCEVCREFAESQTALQRALPSWETPRFSDDFALSVMSKIAEEGLQKRSLSAALRNLFQIRLTVPLPVGALASVLLFVSLMLNFAFWPSRSNDSQYHGAHIAGVPNSNQYILGPPNHITPGPIPVTQGSLPGMDAERGSFIVPREFLGAGAFLLVPIVDPSLQVGERQNANGRTITNPGI